MDLLTIIPARGGSKRLPGKNMLPLGGQPLIGWTIDLALRVCRASAVLVSTDDPAIADFARKRGASVPWLRPPALASDSASSVDVALHALGWFESEFHVPDAILLLQPTSPFRSDSTVVHAIEKMKSCKADAVVGVSPMRGHPEWSLVERGGRLYPSGLIQSDDDGKPGVARFYEPCGALYLVRRDALLQRRAFVAAGDVPLLLESEVERVDIDTRWDWFIAESIVREGIAPWLRGSC